jgi:hypothetical protein
MSPPMGLAPRVTARAAIRPRILPGFLAAPVPAAWANPAAGDETEPPSTPVRRVAPRLPNHPSGADRHARPRSLRRDAK